MPQLFDFKSKTLADFSWSSVSDVAQLWLGGMLSDCMARVSSVKGLRIELFNTVLNRFNTIVELGSAPNQTLILDSYHCPGILHWYGDFPENELECLIDELRPGLEKLQHLQQVLLSAEAFDRGPAIMYMAAELKDRWVLTQANQALLDFLGVALEDIIGINARCQMYEFVHPEDLPKLVTAYDFTRTTTGEITLQYRMRKASGDYVNITERVVYPPESGNQICIATLWYGPQDESENESPIQIFDVLQNMTQDISIESGRRFIAHFVGRLDAIIEAEHMLICAKTQPSWWETWANVHHAVPQPKFHFLNDNRQLLETEVWNSSLADQPEDKHVRLLLPDSRYMTVVPIVQDSEPLDVCLIIGSQKPVKEQSTIVQMVKLFGVRLVREIQQVRIRDAQVEQNQILGQQKEQLTGMVQLLGMLDAVDEEHDFLSLVAQQLTETFRLKKLDFLYWQNGDWQRVEQLDKHAQEWFQQSSLLIDGMQLKELDQCRRIDDLVMDRSRQQVLWPLGQIKAGYLVMAMQFGDQHIDFELLSFSRNSLALALKGLIQKQSFRLQAMRDSLTGLGNRSQLHEWMKQYLAKSEQSSLLLFDLNRFKEINDSFGHQFGDKLLREIGPRIYQALGDVKHYLARLGGDEFALFFPGMLPAKAYYYAEMLRNEMAESYLIDGLRFQVEASIGVAHYPLHGTDGHELLRRADVAMYAAKNSGRNIQQFEDELDNATPLRIAVLAGLDEALEGGDIWVAYQPLMSTKTGQTGGFEALIRWTHPEYGALSPADFIPLAEMGEGIRKITDFVLHNSMNYLQKWREIVPDLHVAVNISPQVLLDHQFPRNIELLLQSYEMPGDALILELTESTLLVDPVRAVEIINVLGNMGVNVEIDDFGTGYSSLAYLKSLPISALKIDRSFIGDILDDPHNEVIVSSTIQMAHSLGLKTIAEGVEDEATLLKMMRLGCDMIQGYYYAKPIPGTDVTQWLIRNK